MSDEPIQLSGEWYTVAAYVRDALQRLNLRVTVLTTPARCNLSTNTGNAIIVGDGDTTTIMVEHYEGFERQWETIITNVKHFMTDVRNIRRLGQPTLDEVVEQYMRSRAQGTRVTLRALADGYGLNYETLRKHKQRYVAASKWGAKRGQVSR